MVNSEEKLWSALGYVLGIFGTWVVPLVVFFVYKDKSRFVAFHALQAVFVHVLIFAVWAVLFWTVIIPLIAHVAFVVFTIIAAIKASEGQLYEMPVIGGFARSMSGN